jgi:hypothetical protein
MNTRLLADNVAEQHKGSVRSRALSIALWSLGSAIFLGSFRWTLVEYLTVFLEPLVEAVATIFFVVSLIWSAIHLLRQRKKEVMNAALPLGVNVVTVLLVVFVPFTRLTIAFDFRVHCATRTEVARDVLAGKYEKEIKHRGSGDLIPLPGRLFYLSSGGEIVRERRGNDTLILFFSFRGVLSSFSGFVYSPDDRPPENGDFNARFSEIDRLRQNWFWVSSRN